MHDASFGRRGPKLAPKIYINRKAKVEIVPLLSLFCDGMMRALGLPES